MQRFSVDSLLRLPVRLRGIEIGHPVDVIVDLPNGRALGLDVRCKDDAHRFLPLTAAVVGEDEIALTSSLTLLAADELAFYRKRADTARRLRGAAVTVAGREVGKLEDVVVAADGTITDVVVTHGRQLRLDERVRVIAEPRRVDAA